MPRKELDLVVMAQINALRTPVAHRSPSAHGQEDFRPRAQMKFFLQGVQVCQKVFLFVHAISRNRFKNLCDSVSNHGVIDGCMGMLGKGLTMLFHIQALNEQKVIVLPSDMSKTKVYKNYKAVCVQQQLRPMLSSRYGKTYTPI